MECYGQEQLSSEAKPTNWFEIESGGARFVSFPEALVGFVGCFIFGIWKINGGNGICKKRGAWRRRRYVRDVSVGRPLGLVDSGRE